MTLVLSLFSLADRVALVTGGNSGIGRAIAQAFAAAGARVVLVARRTAELDEARDEIIAVGGEAATLACDLADSDAIDDCARACAVKEGGGRVWLGLSSRTQSIRESQSFGEIGRMVSRTAFTQLQYSLLLLAGTAAGLLLTYVVPPVAAFTGNAAGALAWVLMSAAYLPALRFYRRSPLWAPLLPLVALFYLGATIHSAVAYARGAGGMWKGRVQAAPQ